MAMRARKSPVSKPTVDRSVIDELIAQPKSAALRRLADTCARTAGNRAFEALEVARTLMIERKPLWRMKTQANLVAAMADIDLVNHYLRVCLPGGIFRPASEAQAAGDTPVVIAGISGLSETAADLLPAATTARPKP